VCPSAGVVSHDRISDRLYCRDGVRCLSGPEFGFGGGRLGWHLAIDPRDLAYALGAGYVPVRRQSHEFAPMVNTPATAAVGRIVASVALTNTSLTIANQPDTMDQIKARVDPGTLAITAGTLTVTHAANDGTAQVDVLSLVTGSSTPLTVPFSKGVMTVASAVVSGLVGGSSPKIQIDTTAALAVAVPPNAVDVTIL
jgi:hypothetical protein